MEKDLIVACSVEGIMMITGSLRRLAVETEDKFGKNEALGFIDAMQDVLNERIDKIRQMIRNT